MKRNTRRRWIGLLSLGLIAVAAIVVVLAVFAGTNDTNFTATGYSDVIRFQAEGVATLQVQVFDLSGKVVWDSSIVSGDTIDWDRNNDSGERLAYVAYIYSAQGWNASGDLNFQKNGKLALMPGDKVQLQQAPAPSSPDLNPFEGTAMTVQPKAVGETAYYSNVDLSGTNFPQYIMLSNLSGAHQWSFFGSDTGFYVRDRTTGKNPFVVANGAPNNALVLDAQGHLKLSGSSYPQYIMKSTLSGSNEWSFFASDTGYYIRNRTTGVNTFQIANSAPANSLNIQASGNVGVGTANTPARLTVQASSGDLIAAYNSSNRVFVVKSTGEVHADGAYYGASFNTGSADVAERINTSEWVEPGNVVEIDPKHAGFFRKSSSPYSTKVAGIISTSPGVILGNNFDEVTDDWEDNRPVLAVTGRVPCKVSTENGPIEIGDLLVASSTPGVAMKGNPERAIGAVVGKAMEPLKEGEGTIVVQVMLR